jgi:hypothetical protein
MLHCCPHGFPVCGAGTCAAAAGAAATVPWLARVGGGGGGSPSAAQQVRDDLWIDASMGRAPPPTPPPPLYPFECSTAKIGCFAEVGGQDGWANRTVPGRSSRSRSGVVSWAMDWGAPMSVTECARFCHQGMDLVDWRAGAAGFNVTLAGNHLCGCSAGLPPAGAK